MSSKLPWLPACHFGRFVGVCLRWDKLHEMKEHWCVNAGSNWPLL